MSRTKLFSSLLVVLTLLLCQSARTEAQSSDKAALDIAQTWLALVDQGKYGESWDAAAQMMKGAVKRESWGAMLSAERNKFGGLVSRKLDSEETETSVSGAPDGLYVVLTYKSSFKQKSAVETVTAMRDEDGKWRVLRYAIRRAR